MLSVATKHRVWSSKNHQERSVFIGPILLEWLDGYRAQPKFPDEDDWIFSTRNRTPVSPFLLLPAALLDRLRAAICTQSRSRDRAGR